MIDSLTTPKYGIVALCLVPEDPNVVEIRHFVGYWEKPTPIEFVSVEKELRLDPYKFNVDNCDWRLMLATEEMIKYYTESIVAIGSNI